MPVALVTGGSRGVGRGVTLALASSGFTVFATGRSIDSADLPPSVVRIQCDHSRDADTACAFQRIAEARGGLDLLVNSAWGRFGSSRRTGGAVCWTPEFVPPWSLQRTLPL
jgi:NAD(P)-dependent dehydrogenase (short-subunit alcohol dehydrogenase family)